MLKEEKYINFLNIHFYSYYTKKWMLILERDEHTEEQINIKITRIFTILK